MKETPQTISQLMVYIKYYAQKVLTTMKEKETLFPINSPFATSDLKVSVVFSSHHLYLLQ